jgi:murein L,D-transpeptidase YcbB/YkuD
MSWRLAESLKPLRAQINAAFPNRDKASDGSIGDARHSARTSDHNPNDARVVCAIDTDEDLSHTIHSIEAIVSAIRASKDPRVNYIIYENRITVRGSNLQQWKPYTGENPHDHHFHISVKQDPRLYDDPRPWDIGVGIAQPDLASPATEPAPDNQRPLLKVGARGQRVRDLQKALGVDVDGVFGSVTHNAVVQFQREKGLKADGIVGPATWGVLGL